MQARLRRTWESVITRMYLIQVYDVGKEKENFNLPFARNIHRIRWLPVDCTRPFHRFIMMLSSQSFLILIFGACSYWWIRWFIWSTRWSRTSGNIKGNWPLIASGVPFTFSAMRSVIEIRQRTTSITMMQTAFIEEILHRFGMADCAPSQRQWTILRLSPSSLVIWVKEMSSNIFNARKWVW